MDLKELRESTGLTQTKMAAKLGVSFSTLRKWEAGLSTPRPALWEVSKYCSAYLCSLRDLSGAAKETYDKFNKGGDASD